MSGIGTHPKPDTKRFSKNNKKPCGWKKRTDFSPWHENCARRWNLWKKTLPSTLELHIDIGIARDGYSCGATTKTVLLTDKSTTLETELTENGFQAWAKTLLNLSRKGLGQGPLWHKVEHNGHHLIFKPQALEAPDKNTALTAMAVLFHLRNLQNGDVENLMVAQAPQTHKMGKRLSVTLGSLGNDMLLW